MKMVNKNYFMLIKNIVKVADQAIMDTISLGI